MSEEERNALKKATRRQIAGKCCKFFKPKKAGLRYLASRERQRPEVSIEEILRSLTLRLAKTGLPRLLLDRNAVISGRGFSF